MKVQINGEEREFGDVPGRFTLAVLVESLGMKADRVAVELNRDIVPRDRWEATAIQEGDRLEVVHFVGGGLPNCSPPPSADDGRARPFVGPASSRWLRCRPKELS